jgi:pullulanase
MSDILARRQTHFVLWCPTAASPPELIIGHLKNGNPSTFQQLNRLPFQSVYGVQGLWELEAAACGLTDGETYHYWFEIDDTLQAAPRRLQTTDPLAYGVDYRLYAPANPTIEHPAAVIGWFEGKLVARDPNGEKGEPAVAPFDRLPSNNQMVIYGLCYTGNAGW